MSTAAIVGISWALCFLLAWRPLFRGLMGLDRHHDWETVSANLFFATWFSVMAGPFILAFFAARRLVGDRDAERFARRIGGESRDDRVNRLEREATEREQRISQLEREVGYR